MSFALTPAASAEPGFSFERSWPISEAISARIASAFSADPRACSSMTRSSSETTKVTPAAFTAWRSTGDSRYGLFGSRVAEKLFFAMSASVPTGLPLASVT